MSSPPGAAFSFRISAGTSPEMIVVLFQSARVSVFETTYFGMPFIFPTISGSPPAVGQNAAQICHVRRPRRSASAPMTWARL